MAQTYRGTVQRTSCPQGPGAVHDEIVPARVHLGQTSSTLTGTDAPVAGWRIHAGRTSGRTGRRGVRDDCARNAASSQAGASSARATAGSTQTTKLGPVGAEREHGQARAHHQAALICRRRPILSRSKIGFGW